MPMLVHLASAPHQLPAPVAHFAGRDAEMAALSGLAAGQAGTVVISAVGGMAGVGKTALAVHWAHQVADRFRDGQLYVNLRGFGPSGQPGPARRGRAGIPGRARSRARAEIPADHDGAVGHVPQPAGRQADADRAGQRAG